MYQTRKMLKRDIAMLRQDLAKALQQSTFNANSAAITGVDRQAMVDMYYDQQTRSWFGFLLQMGLICSFLCLMFAAGTYIAWQQLHFGVGVVLTSVATLFFGFLTFSVGRKVNHGPGKLFQMPSGEIVRVSDEQLRRTERTLVMMAQD